MYVCIQIVMRASGFVCTYILRSSGLYLLLIMITWHTELEKGTPPINQTGPKSLILSMFVSWVPRVAWCVQGALEGDVLKVHKCTKQRFP